MALKNFAAMAGLVLACLSFVSCSGAPGPAGEPGPVGAPGPRGAAGSQGRPGEPAPNPADILLTVRDSVVCIRAHAAADCFSGFYTDGKGTVLTTNEVIEPNTVYSVTDSVGRSLDYRLSGIEGPAAILVPDGGFLPETNAIQVAGSFTLGESVTVAGYPSHRNLGRVLTATRGIIASDPLSQSDGWGWVYFIVDVEGGLWSFGAPVINDRGKVVGVIYDRDSLVWAVDLTAEP